MSKNSFRRAGDGMVSRWVSIAALIFVIVVIGILFYRVMVGFFVPLFLAALLVVIFRPIHQWFAKRLGDRPRTAAGLTTLAILLIVLIPSCLVIAIAAAQGTRLLSGVNSTSLAIALQRARHQFGLAIEHPETFDQLSEVIDELTADPDPTTTPQKIQLAQDLLQQLRDQYPHASPAALQLFDRSQQQLVDLHRDLRIVLASRNLPPPPPTAETERVEGSTAGRDEVLLEQAAAGNRFSPLEQYQRTLIDVHATVESLQTVLLGGTIRAQLKRLANPTDQDISDRLEQVRLYAQANLATVASATGDFLLRTLLGLVILMIAVYFFLVDGPGMTRTLMRLSPLDDRYEERLLLEFDRTSRAVVLATVLSALAQGVLAAIGYYFVGLDSVVLLFLATTFMALIPFFGALSVWLPCVLWLALVDQRWMAAILLAIYGAAIVSTVDNVIKVLILHGRSQLHPLLALLSVLGGVQVFGPIGLLVGPMVVVFLQTLLEILNHELARDDAAELAESSPHE